MRIRRAEEVDILPFERSSWPWQVEVLGMRLLSSSDERKDTQDHRRHHRMTHEGLSLSPIVINDAGKNPDPGKTKAVPLRLTRELKSHICRASTAPSCRYKTAWLRKMAFSCSRLAPPSPWSRRPP